MVIAHLGGSQSRSRPDQSYSVISPKLNPRCRVADRDEIDGIAAARCSAVVEPREHRAASVLMRAPEGRRGKKRAKCGTRPPGTVGVKAERQSDGT